MREKFTEGIVMATIGNSRDEGYMVILRKIGMVLYSWKHDSAIANWDIGSFWEKTLENLIHNPFPLYLHQTFLTILRQHKTVAKENSVMQ